MSLASKSLKTHPLIAIVVLLHSIAFPAEMIPIPPALSQKADSFFNSVQDTMKQQVIAMIALVDPDIWIPKWLFTITAKVVFPGVLVDFVKSMRNGT